MLTITEIPHRGEPRTWTAESEDDFCARVMQANPRAGDLSPDMPYEEVVAWLRRDLRGLTIEQS